jgi:stage V sporulation protein K
MSRVREAFGNTLVRQVLAVLGLVMWFYVVHMARQHGWHPSPNNAGFLARMSYPVLLLFAATVAFRGDLEWAMRLAAAALVAVPVMAASVWLWLVFVVALIITTCVAYGTSDAAIANGGSSTRNEDETTSTGADSEVAPESPVASTDDPFGYGEENAEQPVPLTAGEHGQQGDGIEPEPLPPIRPLAELLAELDSKTGLDAVKQQVREEIDFLAIQANRKALGLKEASNSEHLVFLGNPGTGKTEIARLLGQIYRSMGLLAKGHFVEVDRQAFIGPFQGHTEEKTNALIERALDGVLLIDEAYALVQDENDTFGKIAADLLLKRMEDERSRLIVIIAGYANEMSTFLDSNPGFRSRFTREITFPDYSPDDLASIIGLMVRQEDYRLAPDCDETLHSIFVDASRRPSFGNARYARNLVGAALKSHATRVRSLSAEDLTEEMVATLTTADFEAAAKKLANEPPLAA